MTWRDRLRRVGRPGTPGRSEGLPPSANGASSFHLGWSLPTVGDGVAVTLEVLEPPEVAALYFWAVQVDVAGPGGRAGGAHLGLQWHPQHPGSTAVNWGGYGADGSELPGSRSTLRSATGNANTRDLAWVGRRPYRLRVDRLERAVPGEPPDGVPAARSAARPATLPGGVHAWRGSVQDLLTGELVVVRDLYMAGDQVVGATMWSEVFARCDDPPVTVRWSDPVVRAGGVDLPIAWVTVNYQAHHDGGCSNTTSWVDGGGVLQRTAVERDTPQGTRLDLRTG